MTQKEIEAKIAELSAQYQEQVRECDTTIIQYRELLNKKEVEFYEFRNQIKEQIHLCHNKLHEQKIEFMKAKADILKEFEDERDTHGLQEL